MLNNAFSISALPTQVFEEVYEYTWYELCHRHQLSSKREKVHSFSFEAKQFEQPTFSPTQPLWRAFTKKIIWDMFRDDYFLTEITVSIT